MTRTEGPWRAKKLGDGWLIVAGPKDREHVVGAAWDIYGGDDGGVMDEEDARLIAAAPELYEALRAILKRDPALSGTHPEAHSALAKAGGRS